MILNSTPENQAILSNVGEIGEFRIRNSAKAFNILSSGLYANKIKAIIRELSCNAVDSHVAAGKADVPFLVHIPTSLEPHFSIRDYGTGLTHDQVTQIYTTYFESTKTTSNEFIGALGLGSKSPFSYTDNFTVTAIRDGVKGIYSAFINAEGVPSIALMFTEQTDEPAGVEVKFSVNDRYDFYKFKEEAEEVFKYFKLRPTVEGSALKIVDREYETENLLPGVSVLKNKSYRTNSVAIMGNIAYPISVPNASTVLGDYSKMLDCGLEIQFGIGEVDFQASREGLSYIPQTVEAIKNKLIEISKVLSERVKNDAEQYTNLWDRAIFLDKKREHSLWLSAVSDYVNKNPIPTINNTSRYGFLSNFELPETELASKFNIVMRGFSRTRGNASCAAEKIQTKHVRAADGSYSQYSFWSIPVSATTDFVVNDLKTGAGERAKYHYRETEMTVHQRVVFVLDRADSTKDMDTVGFFDAIKNPPADRIYKASTLMEKPRKDSSVGRNVSLLRMKTRRRGYSDTVVWGNAGNVADYDVTKTHYYIPLSGYVAQGKVTDAKVLRDWMRNCGLAALYNVEIFGVRKADIEDISKRVNWVNVEVFIEQTLQKPDQKLVLNLVSNEVSYGISDFAKYVGLDVNHSSPFYKAVELCKKYDRVHFNEYALRQLYELYGAKFDLTATVKKFVDEISDVNKRYPLLGCLTGRQSSEAVQEYVNLIDNLKGI
jgi:hypothetical protein